MSETFEKVLTLKNVSMFENASENALSDLIMCSDEKSYKSGEEILTNMQENQYLYIVLSGSVHCFKPDSDEIVLEFNTRQFFGETTVLCPAVIPYRIVASGKTTLLRIHGNKLYQMMSLHPSLAMGFVGELSKQLRQRSGKNI